VIPPRFLLAAALTFAGCARHDSATATAPLLPPVAVRTAVVQSALQPTLLETSGTVRALQRATLAAKVPGTIAMLAVTLGQSVNEGDVLLTLSAVELTARVSQVRAQLAQTERELARERTLQSSGAGTVDAVKTVEDRLAQIQAALREAETLRDYATVRAPFAGVIAKKFVEAGDFAAPGAPLLQLDGRNAFEIEVGLPDSLSAPLALGTTLEISPSDTALRFRAAIAELSSATDSTTRTVTAKLTVPPGTSVRAGQFVHIAIPSASAPVLSVPTSSLSAFGQMERVFVVGENNRASLRLVRTGSVFGDRTTIASGLAADERVVLAPSATLRDGQPLTLIP
jgi:membrane fusion protein (multidrug efflux system)